MVSNIVTYMNKVSRDSDGKGELSFDAFAASMAEENTRIGDYAKGTFKFQYEVTKTDMFIHRFNELKFIGFDLSSDAVLMNPMTDMNIKIDHFVDTYYVRSRTSPSYVKSMFYTLKQFVASDNDDQRQKRRISSLKSNFESIFKASTHQSKNTFSPAKNLCLLIIGIDAHILCVPNDKQKCDGPKAGTGGA